MPFNSNPLTLGPIVTDIDGVELNQVDKEVLLHPKLGGLIFFSRHFESIEQFDGLVRTIREIRPNLILSVDQEGGRVQRFRNGLTRLPPMSHLGMLYQEHPELALEKARKIGWLLAYELLCLGVDHSYTPVLDLDDGQSQVIGDRSFSKHSITTTHLAKQLIGGMNTIGMAATAKHFPGHGSVIADSHLELPIDGRSFDTIWQYDLKPFAALKSEYQAVMTAHIAFPEFDEHPVSFSGKWIQDILRAKIGFKGIVFSDDLSMKGAAEYGSMHDRVERALYAGCDAVLICNQRTEAEYALEYVESKALGKSDVLNKLKSDINAYKLKYNEHRYREIKAEYKFEA